MSSDVDDRQDKKGLAGEYSDDYARMCYQHQYDRFGKLESTALTLTNIVITLSVAAFMFGFKDAVNDTLTVFNGVVLPIAIIVTNLFAVAYIRRSYRYMLTHQRRAKRILKERVPSIYAIDESDPIFRPYTLGGRTSIQTIIHLIFVLLSFVPFSIYLYCLIKSYS